MEYFYIFLVVIAALLTASYIQGLIFVVFKANKYEDLLAAKIAKRVIKALKEFGNVK